LQLICFCYELSSFAEGGGPAFVFALFLFAFVVALAVAVKELSVRLSAPRKSHAERRIPLCPEQSRGLAKPEGKATE
jgi:hypothetical protein